LKERKKMTEYFENDIKITVYNYKNPRKSERTWVAMKGSIANIGRKAETLNSFGILKHKRG
jgi:hypothetical protein